MRAAISAPSPTLPALSSWSHDTLTRCASRDLRYVPRASARPHRAPAPHHLHVIRTPSTADNGMRWGGMGLVERWPRILAETKHALACWGAGARGRPARGQSAATLRILTPSACARSRALLHTWTTRRYADAIAAYEATLRVHPWAADVVMGIHRATRNLEARSGRTGHARSSSRGRRSSSSSSSSSSQGSRSRERERVPSSPPSPEE